MLYSMFPLIYLLRQVCLCYLHILYYIFIYLLYIQIQFAYKWQLCVSVERRIGTHGSMNSFSVNICGRCDPLTHGDIWKKPAFGAPAPPPSFFGNNFPTYSNPEKYSSILGGPYSILIRFTFSIQVHIFPNPNSIIFLVFWIALCHHTGPCDAGFYQQNISLFANGYATCSLPYLPQYFIQFKRTNAYKTWRYPKRKEKKMIKRNERERQSELNLPIIVTPKPIQTKIDKMEKWIFIFILNARAPNRNVCLNRNTIFSILNQCCSCFNCILHNQIFIIYLKGR